MAEYQIATAADKRQLTEFLMREGQFLLPMVKLIEQSEKAIDELIDVTGRAAIEAVLELSAQEKAGAKSPGKTTGQVRWHGRQEGVVQLAYGCSKAALETAAYYLSRELGPRAIRVNTVAPGWKWGPTLETGMRTQAEQLGVPMESLLAPVRETIALKRFADDDDVANAVVFLLSDRARAITGQTIFVDGGLTLYADFREPWSSQ